MTLNYKMQRLFYYKMRQVFHYKMRQLLQNDKILLENLAVITNCDVYYKMHWRNE